MGPLPGGLLQLKELINCFRCSNHDLLEVFLQYTFCLKVTVVSMSRLQRVVIFYSFKCGKYGHQKKVT